MSCVATELATETLALISLEAASSSASLQNLASQGFQNEHSKSCLYCSIVSQHIAATQIHVSALHLLKCVK